jgi:hypothetical protein
MRAHKIISHFSVDESITCLAVGREYVAILPQRLVPAATRVIASGTMLKLPGRKLGKD